jgi:hypothetical protein
MRRIRNTEAEHNLVREVGETPLVSVYRDFVSIVLTCAT